MRKITSAVLGLATALVSGSAASAAIVGEVPAGSFVQVPSGSQNLGSFSIVIVPGATLAANAPALAAWTRAANQWANRISDPITVTVNADLAALPAGVIGSTSSVILQGGYTTIRDAVVADASNEADDSIVGSMPTAAQFSATLKAGNSLSGNLLGTKANLKALNFAGLDAGFGVSDGSITFSTVFNFDYDNSNGVTAGAIDFETVAAHELGHLLGFFSAVDNSDGGATSISPNTLDLFRFGRLSNNPVSAANFTTFARNLAPGADTITDDLTNEYRMSTGINLGDGNQASHWKADEITGTLIGIMDPTLATGVVETVGFADTRAMDLIGYEIAPVPEPSSALLLGATSLLLILPRKRRSAR